jgi:aspartokinase-like uncharacterized kinase
VSRPVVVKVGGSLLDWPGLPDALSTYLHARRDEPLVLLVGGGRSTDVVRDLDRIHQLGPTVAHRLALHSLDLTAQVLAAIVPGLVVVDRRDDLHVAWSNRRTPVFAPRPFLDEEDIRSPQPLPHSWDVTSDSIAARLAESLGASELALLKSAPPATAMSRREAAAAGLVDPVFPAAAARLERVSYRNLRDPATLAVLLTR